MAISATRLRQNLYNILDQVLRTGVPAEVERNGRILRIVPEKQTRKWDRLERRPICKVDPEDIVHIDWSSEWRGSDALP